MVLGNINMQIVGLIDGDVESFSNDVSSDWTDEGSWGGECGDPLSQTFTVQSSAEGDGRFITSLDLFFSAKDDTLPVTVEIRNVINGYPGPKILPFGRVVKNHQMFLHTGTASTATTFTFDSPVYLKPNIEYCISIISYSPEYKVWISRMGETDIGGTRTISEQPHTGVLFKSSNNTSWAPSFLEDLKFSVLKLLNYSLLMQLEQ